MADKKLKETLIKSTIGAVPKNKKTIEALGLTKLYKTVVLLLTFKNVDNVHNSVHNSFLGHFEVYFC